VYENGAKKLIYKKLGFTGSFYDGFVDGYNSYAERGMFTPLPLGYLVMHLSPENLSMECVYL
jgi:hypothetical protein